ncbi:MAG: DMT family transporter, partial [Candidatus Competibacteraceae bacterium]|nr:DMT family transporter [Candidatus Competibacteraceae bacterium]
SFAAPFIVTVLAVLVLREKVGWRRWSAVAAGFIGVLVIVRPGLGEVHWAVLLSLCGTTCYSVYQILTRGLGAGDDAATTIVYTAIVGTLVASVMIPFYWSPPVANWHWLLFALMGLCGGFGHYFVVKAFQYGEAAVVAPFGYAQLIGTTILGYLIFNDIPDFWTWVGASIIVGSSAFIAYREAQVRGRT